MNSLHLLKTKKLRLTECRTAVIDFFLAHAHAISQSDLEKNMHQFDRVTLYRTLLVFMEKNLIHKVLDGSGVAKYAICPDTCLHQPPPTTQQKAETTHSSHTHHAHVHFQCLQCQHTTCIQALPIPTVNLPQGYQFYDANFLVRGTCQKCNK